MSWGALRSLSSFAFAALASLGASACASDSVATSQGTGSSESGETTNAGESGETAAATESSETDTNDSANQTSEPGLSFYAGPEDFAPVQECDPWLQDCPEGEKCVPYGSTGGNWDANKCVPITGDGQPGDPCTYGGVVEATDDCNGSSHCWDVEDVDGMAIGTCTSFCTGTPDDPQCPTGSHCLISNKGSISLCVATCDPVLQDCEGSTACFWASNQFTCLSSSQDLPTGDPCGFVNDCAGTNVCLDAAVFPDCAGEACCAAYCDLQDPDACPDPQLECAAFFDAQVTPEGFEHVGVCVLPP